MTRFINVFIFSLFLIALFFIGCSDSDDKAEVDFVSASDEDPVQDIAGDEEKESGTYLREDSDGKIYMEDEGGEFPDAVDDGGAEVDMDVVKEKDCLGVPGGSAVYDNCGVCNGDNSTCDCSPGSFCEEIVNSHNKVRQMINDGTYWEQPVPDVPLQNVVWDDLLAEVAHNYAAGCHWGHNPNRTEEYAEIGGSGYIGENLAASSNQPTTDSVVIIQWGDEAKFYDYDSNSCSDVCGHYTQVVWNTTARIGCAMAYCDSFTGGISWSGYFTVCNYAPGGNMNGQRPY